MTKLLYFQTYDKLRTFKKLNNVFQRIIYWQSLLDWCLWFGGLKFFNHLSPAEDLAKNTVQMLTFGFIPSNISIILLAVWETLIGVLLILNVFRKPVIILVLVHLTFTPLLFFPNQSFNHSPLVLTLLGQYIFKNVIIIGALITLYRQSVMVKTII